jgi:hypothetical protein
MEVPHPRHQDGQPKEECDENDPQQLAAERAPDCTYIFGIEISGKGSHRD